MITLLTIQRKKYQAGNFIFSGTNACTNCSESIDNKGNLDFVSESNSVNSVIKKSTKFFI